MKEEQEKIVEQAMAQPLEKKIRQALMLLQIHEPKALDLWENGYYLAFSGGKDSVVIKRLAQMAGVKFESHYNNVTIDPPELVRFIKKHHPNTVWNNPEKHLLTRMVEKRTPPTRLIRWCCSEYKEKGGDGCFKIIGVRAAESARRKGIWKQVVLNKRTGIFLCPILYWTDEDVWNFIRQQNLPYCPLYDEGFSRLGCIGCPLGGPKAQRKEFDRWPKYEALWKRAFKKLYEGYKFELTRKGTPRFFAKYDSWEEFYEWWVSGTRENKKYLKKEECQGSFMFSKDEDGEE